MRISDWSSDVCSSDLIGTAFQGGYEPTGVNGIVTGLGYDSGESGIVTTGTGRHISEIDGEPAAVVYDRWTDGSLPRDALRDGGHIRGATTMVPLGISEGRIAAVPPHRRSDLSGKSVAVRVVLRLRVISTHNNSIKT